MEKVITMIYPANIMTIWNQLPALLEPALAITKTHNIEDLRQSLLAGKSQLWIQWSNKVEAAVVTEFVGYPRGVWCRFWLAGALKDANIMWEKFFDVLWDFAKENKCAGIEDCGRGGWSRYAPQALKIAVLRRIPIGV